MRFWRRLGRVVSYPVRLPGKILRQAGREVATGAIDQTRESFGLPTFRRESGGPVLGLNRYNNLAGWLGIVVQILQVVIPLIQGQPPVVPDAKDASILALSLAAINSKDRQVTGVGPNARREG